MNLSVSAHARSQAKARRLYRYSDGRAERSLDRLAEVIDADVRAEIRAGRLSRVKPAAFTLYGEKPNRQLDAGEWFVSTPDGRRGFIVKRDGDEWIVVTALSRARAEAA